MKRDAEPTILVLAGHSWKANHLDWNRRIAYVEPSEQRGRSRWLGEGQMLAHMPCQSIRSVLAGDEHAPFWSQRATQRITEIRAEFPWVDNDSTSVLQEPDGDIRWFTFAGGIANKLLADQIPHESPPIPDNLSILFRSPCEADELIRLISSISADDVRPVPNDDAMEQLKFSECLPRSLAVDVFTARFNDLFSIRKALREPRRVIVDSTGSDSTVKIDSAKAFRKKRSPGGKTISVATRTLMPPDPAVVAELSGMKALSVRQPGAGRHHAWYTKASIEYRSGPTRIRGRILI